MRNNKGFSLVELIVVIAIMAILAAVAIPTFSSFITKAQDSSNVQEIADLTYAAELACMEYGVNVTYAIADDNKSVTLTFSGDDADAAADAAEQVGTVATTATVADKVVTLAFDKALSDDGEVDATATLAKLNKYAPAGGNG